MSVRTNVPAEMNVPVPTAPHKRRSKDNSMMPITTSFLIEEYVNKERSFRDIANELGTYANKVRRQAIKVNVFIIILSLLKFFVIKLFLLRLLGGIVDDLRCLPFEYSFEYQSDQTW